MSKVVKFYYTRPLSFLEVAIVPIRETVAVPQQKTRMSERYTIAADGRFINRWLTRNS